jgi:hypothetical protein
MSDRFVKVTTSTDADGIFNVKTEKWGDVGKESQE